MCVRELFRFCLSNGTYFYKEFLKMSLLQSGTFHSCALLTVISSIMSDFSSKSSTSQIEYHSALLSHL